MAQVNNLQVNNLIDKSFIDKSISEKLIGAKRIVVKVGTSSVTYANGKLHIRRIELLARQLADLHNSGREMILVSSGAVGAGIGKLGLSARPRVMPQVQALSAVGQGILMQSYEKFFGEYGINVAQLLLTKEDFEDGARYSSLENTLAALLDYGVVPIVNENDPTVFRELKVGDNDTLAALVAGAVQADLLVLLSDIEGLYTADPRSNDAAELIHTVHGVTEEIEAMAGGAGSGLATGGMATKLKAAKMANNAGVPMVLTNSLRDNVLLDLADGKLFGTIFLPVAGK